MAEEKIGNLTLNKIYNGDCMKGLQEIPDESLDLIITSPPYDNMRTYNSEIDLTKIGQICYEKLKNGGIMVMVIQDQTINFGKTCTTARTIVNYVDKIKFKLFENVIWAKDGRPGVWWNRRFRVDHEYILIFLKGERPQYFNKEPLKIPAKTAGKEFSGTTRLSNGELKRVDKKIQNETKCRGTIWNITSSKSERDLLKLEHPATFPDRLVEDLILCFSDEGMVVADPFMGSGTTGIMAKKLNRKFIGFEIDRDYWALAKKRLKMT